MKRTDLVRKLEAAGFVFRRFPRAPHDKYARGNLAVAVPRHRQIEDSLASGSCGKPESSRRADLLARAHTAGRTGPGPRMRALQLTAAYRQRGEWYVGEIAGAIGVHSQGRTFEEARRNLVAAALDILETHPHQFPTHPVAPPPAAITETVLVVVPRQGDSATFPTAGSPPARRGGSRSRRGSRAGGA